LVQKNRRATRLGALRAVDPVLREEEAPVMIAAARSANVFLHAYRLHNEPGTVAVLEHIRCPRSAATGLWWTTGDLELSEPRAETFDHRYGAARRPDGWIPFCFATKIAA
jgi:hypothetical protein